MRYIAVNNLSRPAMQPLIAAYCTSFWHRLRGLMFQRSLPDRQGVLLVQRRDSRLDSSIHMLFMWMDLAVIWINDAGEVVDAVLAKRWHPAYFPKKPARYILELPASCVEELQIGDKVKFEEAWLD